MNDSPLEKAAALAVLAFSSAVLIVTPWPDIDQLLGLPAQPSRQAHHNSNDHRHEMPPLR